MNGTSGISGLTGGNLMDPPEPVLSRVDWERRHGLFPFTPIRMPCHVPAPTEAQVQRAEQFRSCTRYFRAGRRALLNWPFPLFDDEPTVRCEEVCRV